MNGELITWRQEAVFAAIRHFVRMGKNQMNVHDIASHAGIDVLYTSEPIHTLVRWGAIKRERFGKGYRYSLTGLSLAEAVKCYDAGHGSFSQPSMKIDRDPCWRCGVRGDVGCAHRAHLGRADFGSDLGKGD